jgi:RimJ/RimL family protein N-acetyltransferase
MAAMDVALVPAVEDDLTIIERLTQDPEATGEFAWFGWHDPLRWRRGWTEDRLLGDNGAVLMVVRDSKRAGFVSWRRQQAGRAAYRWEIGIALAPEARGRGIGTRAQLELVRYLFAHTTAHRIQATTETGNVAEQRALERAGFTREGVLRGVGWRDGEWRDGLMYSILRTDPSWAALRPGAGAVGSATP